MATLHAAAGAYAAVLELQHMAVLSVRNIPAELMLEAKLLACASGQPLRMWVINTIGAAVAADVSVGARASRRAKRRPTSKSTAKPVGQPPATPEGISSKTSREKMEPCSHGLLFHPGCTD